VCGGWWDVPLAADHSALMQIQITIQIQEFLKRIFITAG